MGSIIEVKVDSLSNEVKILSHIQIGNITISVIWVAVFIAFLIASLILRFFRKSGGDWLWNGFFLYFLVWKLSYGLFNLSFVLENPISLLYFDGGIKGHFLGLLLLGGYLFFVIRKTVENIYEEMSLVLPAFFISFELILRYLEGNILETAFHLGLILIFLYGTKSHLQKRQNPLSKWAWNCLLSELLIINLFRPLFSLDSITLFLFMGILGIIENFQQRHEVSNIKMKRTVIITALFGVLIGVINVGDYRLGNWEEVISGELSFFPTQSKEAFAKVGEAAPNFELPTLDGHKAKLSDYKGKIVILNFWATWCPPCQAEMPHMQNFYEENHQKGIEIVAINLTSSDRGLDKVKEFVNKHHITFPILLDEEGTVENIYDTIAIPTTYIIDQEGFITEKITGPVDEERLENLIKGIL